MNLILSLLVSVALMFSPTGSLPAQPDTAVTWTLSNISLDLPQGSVTLNPALRLSSAVGSEEAQLHFEIINGENTLLPVSGLLTRDELLFSLGKSGSAYRISNADLMNILPMDQDSLAAMDVIAEVVQSYFQLLSKEIHDADFSRQVSEASFAAIIEGTDAQIEQTEMEVDGVSIPAQRIEINFTPETMFKMLDVLMNCGIPESENFFRSYLKIFPFLSQGYLSEDLSSYTEIYEQLLQLEGPKLDTFSFPLTIIVGVQGEAVYTQMQTDYAMDGQDLSLSLESATIGEETSLDMNMDINLNNIYMGYKLMGSYTGPAEAPTQMDFLYCVNSRTKSYVPIINDAGETQWVETSQDISVTMDLETATKDGLTSGNLVVYTVDPIDETTARVPMKFTLDLDQTREADGSITSVYDLDVNLEATKISSTCTINKAERQEADGSVTTSYKFNLSSNLMEDALGVSFDLNRAEGPVSDLFAGMTIQELKDLSIGTNPGGLNPSAMSLMSDILGLTSDAMNLMSDESVVELMNMFIGSFNPSFGFSLEPFALMQLIPSVNVA